MLAVLFDDVTQSPALKVVFAELKLILAIGWLIISSSIKLLAYTLEEVKGPIFKVLLATMTFALVV